MYGLLVTVLGLPLSYLITKYYIQLAHQKKIQDIPNERSLHKTPTPRGGGISICVTFLLATVLISTFYQTSPFAFVVGAILVAAVGFLDDLKGVSAKWRLLVHFTAAVIFLFANLTIGQTFYVGPFEWSVQSLSLLFLLLFIVWHINLFNFMDGSDGIAAIQTMTVGFSFLIFNLINHENYLATMSAALIFSALGFYIWNKHPAKVFMGDIASGFLGFVLAGLSIMQALKGSVFFVSAIIIMGSFIFDATITLAMRALQKKKLSQAHRDHIYQHMILRGASHKKVAYLYGALNLFWLLPLAYCAQVVPSLGIFLLAIATLPFLILAYRFKAGISQGFGCDSGLDN